MTLGWLVGDADTDAVVLHTQRQVFARLDRNADVLALRMLDGVVHRFMGDEIKVGRDEVVLDQHRFRAVEGAAQFAFQLGT